jgi:hypothetical protein
MPLSGSKKNAARLFGEKVAADVAPPKPLTMARVQADDAAAKAKGFGGSVSSMFVHDPKDWQVTTPRVLTPGPARQAKPYTPPTAEQAQQQTAVAQLQPQFGQGDIQDIMSLNAQGRGGDMAKFIRNTTTHYRQHPHRAANYGR